MSSVWNGSYSPKCFVLPSRFPFPETCAATGEDEMCSTALPPADFCRLIEVPGVPLTGVVLVVLINKIHGDELN